MRILVFVAMGAVLLSVAACDRTGVNPRAGEAISQEAFVQAYFELRATGLRSPEMEISIEARDSILAHLALTEEDLLTFVDVWGSDSDVMRRVWEVVDSLEREARSDARGGNPSMESDESAGEDPDPRGVGRP